MTQEEMIAELEKDGYKVTKKINQNACFHKNALGFGHATIDGSSHISYNCQDCGKNWSNICEPNKRLEQDFVYWK